MKTKNNNMNAKQERNYLRAYEAAQAGGMNETDCHEFALDQAARRTESAKAIADAIVSGQSGKRAVTRGLPFAKELDFFSWSELLKAGRRLLVADPLKEARVVLTEALCSRNLRHDEKCVALNFIEEHRYCPPAHPIWKEQPCCNCWVGRMAEWLKNNPEVYSC